MTQDNDEQRGEKKRKVAKTIPYKVAKTMLYGKPQQGQQVPPVQETSSSPQPQPPEEPPKVAKTILDHKLIMNVRSQFGQRENQRLEQKILERQVEPPTPIEPIEAQRTVKSCPFSWTEESAKVRFKHCGDCQKAIYHLEGMEMEQVEALILKRENREKFVLYGRPDGKFMTSDCPVAQKKRIQVVTLVAVVALCIVASIAAFIIVGPPSVPTVNSTVDATSPTPVTSGSDPSESGSTSSTSSGSSTSSSSSSSAGTHHYEAGDPMPVTSTPEPSKQAQEKPFTDQEQKGEFWQFPNGQPADDFTPTPGGR